MQDRTFTDSRGDRWERVSRTRARTLYASGAEVAICPVNLRPFGPWACEGYINIGDANDNADPARAFEQQVNTFAWYACANTETGSYLAYYVRA